MENFEAAIHTYSEGDNEYVEAHVSIYCDADGSPQVASCLKGLFSPATLDLILSSKQDKFLIKRFSDKCEGFPCFGKTGIIPDGVSIELRGFFVPSAARPHKLILQCMSDDHQNQKPSFMPFEVNFEPCPAPDNVWTPELPDGDQSPALDRCPVCLLATSFHSVPLSTILYRNGDILSRDPSFVKAVSEDYAILQSLFQNYIFTSSWPFPKLVERSSVHAVFESTALGIMTMQCGSVQKIESLIWRESEPGDTNNGVMRESDVTFSAEADYCPVVATRRIHLECWRDHQRSLLQSRFYGRATTECLNCGKPRCQVTVCGAPPVRITVVFDVPRGLGLLMHLVLVCTRITRRKHFAMVFDSTNQGSDKGGQATV